MFEKPPIDKILHYGIKRRSGRYPWGSGDDPYQAEGWMKFLRDYETLKSRGLKPTEIATKLGMNTTQLRNSITWARAEEGTYNTAKARELKEQGLSNVAIGKQMGVSEASVRNYLKEMTPGEKTQKVQLENITEAIKSGVERTGYLDVGVGVERQLGISREKFNAVVNKLAEEGYHIHQVHVKRLSDPTGDKYTTVKVLTKDADLTNTRKNSDKIRPLDTWSEDNGLSLVKLEPPKMLDLNRIKIRYAEEGGADRDGLIELRPGVEDLDMGNSKYAQVRIGAGDNLYLKGMAAYTQENLPDGVDIIFNTNKAKGTPTEDVLKKMKMTPQETDDPSFMFGSSVIRQKGALNIVNEQGDWNTWSTTMSSQFLSKQSISLIKDRLDATHEGLVREFNEINSMTNPVVKKYLMESYIDGLDAKAKHLKARGLPKTKNHVLLPINDKDFKPNEIYAPRYEDGERVVLVRHPHGGIFEIPELVVNNRNKFARNMIGNAPDAVGIHPSVAEKLSGADFDGDTALVIPNNNRQIKTSRTLKELKNWGDEMHVLYKRDHKTISDRTKQLEMGKISNLITDMTIKGASQSEIARAVKHSMVVIDSEKHNLDYKQSAVDNGISALVKRYQTHTNPDTGKISRGASTLVSRSKRKVDISDPNFDPHKYSSGYVQDELYANYIKGIQSVKNTATKVYESIPRPKYSKDAAKVYAEEIKSLNAKLNTALLNAPRERQAQLLTNNLYYSNLKPEMSKDDKQKLKSRSLAKARDTVGAKRSNIKITDREWEAIQARAVSATKLEQILKNADMDIVRKHAAPRQVQLTPAKLSRAQSLLSRGYTYAEVAKTLGVSTSTLTEELK